MEVPVVARAREDPPAARRITAPVVDRSNGDTLSPIVAEALRAARSEHGYPVVSRRFSTMGTEANIVLVAGTEAMADAIEQTATQLDELWSRFRPTSEISRINNAEGDTGSVHPLTARLVTEMIAARTLTKGEYDPTILPRLIAEGYAASRVDPSMVTTLPASARWPIDPSGTTVTDTSVTLSRGVTLDPGGIGKGTAADVLCQVARAEGALGALIEIGGDVAIVGTPPQGSVWRIGIEPSGQRHLLFIAMEACTRQRIGRTTHERPTHLVVHLACERANGLGTHVVLCCLGCSFGEPCFPRS